MTVHRDSPTPPRRRPGPKPRGRTVVPLTITVTPAQRAELEALADAQKSSVSTVVRRLIAAGLAARSLLSSLIRIGVLRRTTPTEDPVPAPPPSTSLAAISPDPRVQ